MKIFLKEEKKKNQTKLLPVFDSGVQGSLRRPGLGLDTTLHLPVTFLLQSCSLKKSSG